MKQWIVDNYKMIISLIAGIIGGATFWFVNKKNNINGNKNITIQADKDVNNRDSFNSKTLNVAPYSTPTIVEGNQTNNLIDITAIKIVAQGFIVNNYPQSEAAFRELNLNAFAYLNILESELTKLPKNELDKFSKADVLIALQNSIKAAARRNFPEGHQVLTKLIIDRLGKDQSSIVDLTIDEAIETIAKLDKNLIKILSLSFLFSRTKWLGLENESSLFEKLEIVVKNFTEITPSIAKFEYLESISCGKLIQFISNNIIQVISRNYQHLFLKEINKETLEKFDFIDNNLTALFIKTSPKTYKVNPVIALHVFDDLPLYTQGIGSSPLDAELKEKIKEICQENRLAEQEITTLLYEKIQGFKNLVDMWKDYKFGTFSLTAVGIAISRAYLEQAGFGKYDINTWIN